MKYPIGIQSFEVIREDGYVYVDKTAQVYDLVKNGKVYFLSRPRRFGKSLLVSTLECYFRGRKELFDGLAIAGLEEEWNEYPVFHIDFNGGDYTQDGELENTIEDYLSKWESEYGKGEHESTIGNRFQGILQRASERAGRRAVELVDEYDKPILDVLDKGYIPVVSTVGCDTQGHVYNINADTAAARIAGELGAESLIAMTDIGGILRDKDDPSTLIPVIHTADALQLIESGVINGGMLPKVTCCIDAIRWGVHRVFIIDGRVPHAILIEMLTNEGIGTMFVAGQGGNANEYTAT